MADANYLHSNSSSDVPASLFSLESFLTVWHCIHKTIHTLEVLQSEKKSKCQYCQEKLKKGKNGSKKDPGKCPFNLFLKLAEARFIFCDKECHMNYLKTLQRQHGHCQCLLPNCERICHRNPYGGYYNFCGKGHATLHNEFMKMIWECHYQNIDNKQNTSKKGSSTSKTTQILFYNRHDPYYEFTNFADFPVNIDCKRYPTTEHYFQSQKLIGTPYHDQVIVLPYPRQAFEYPRKPGVSKWVRRDWEKVKEDVMYRGLYHKFTQHSYLLILLISTGNAILKEDSPYDSYWGIGPDGGGKNRLGYLLMSLREYLLTQLSHQDIPQLISPGVILCAGETSTKGASVSVSTKAEVSTGEVSPLTETSPHVSVDDKTGELNNNNLILPELPRVQTDNMSKNDSSEKDSSVINISYPKLESTSIVDSTGIPERSLNNLNNPEQEEVAMEVQTISEQAHSNTPLDKAKVDLKIDITTGTNFSSYSLAQPSPPISNSDSSEEDMETNGSETMTETMI